MAPLLPVPTYLIGVTQTVAAATELGGCGIDGGEGHWLLGQEGGAADCASPLQRTCF